MNQRNVTPIQAYDANKLRELPGNEALPIVKSHRGEKLHSESNALNFFDNEGRLKKLSEYAPDPLGRRADQIPGSPAYQIAQALMANPGDAGSKYDPVSGQITGGTKHNRPYSRAIPITIDTLNGVLSGNNASIHVAFNLNIGFNRNQNDLIDCSVSHLYKTQVVPLLNATPDDIEAPQVGSSRGSHISSNLQSPQAPSTGSPSNLPVSSTTRKRQIDLLETTQQQGRNKNPKFSVNTNIPTLNMDYDFQQPSQTSATSSQRMSGSPNSETSSQQMFGSPHSETSPPRRFGSPSSSGIGPSAIYEDTWDERSIPSSPTSFRLASPRLTEQAIPANFRNPTYDDITPAFVREIADSKGLNLNTASDVAIFRNNFMGGKALPEKDLEFIKSGSSGLSEAVKKQILEGITNKLHVRIQEQDRRTKEWNVGDLVPLAPHPVIQFVGEEDW